MKTQYDGWLAILLADAPKDGYDDLTAAMHSACVRSFAGERCEIDGEYRVISRSMTKKALRERDRFCAQ